MDAMSTEQPRIATFAGVTFVCNSSYPPADGQPGVVAKMKFRKDGTLHIARVWVQGIDFARAKDAVRIVAGRVLDEVEPDGGIVKVQHLDSHGFEEVHVGGLIKLTLPPRPFDETDQRATPVVEPNNVIALHRVAEDGAE